MKTRNEKKKKERMYDMELAYAFQHVDNRYAKGNFMIWDWRSLSRYTKWNGISITGVTIMVHTLQSPQ